MPSVRKQILDAIEDKLSTVRTALDWANVLVNPREAVGADQMNAIVFGYGGEAEPLDLTGHVETHRLDFSIGLVVQESGTELAEELLDAGFVAVSDALVDPNDIQLGGLAIDVRRGAMSPPYIGRGADGARITGVQEIEFQVEYMAREGDAQNPGP